VTSPADALDVSLVVPVRDEAPSVAPLADEIAAAMGGLDASWEVIFVDDGSADGTFQRLRDLHRRYDQVRAIRFARNAGKSSALAAGFAAARGRVVVTLDGDLQDDPREIPRFLAALDEGCDLVSGWKRVRRDPLGRRIASRLFNWVIARLSGLPLHDFNCGFKAYRAEVVRGLRLRRGLHRFMPLLARARGHRVGEIAVAHRPRPHGRSKYGWERAPQAMVELHVALMTAQGNEHPFRAYGLRGAIVLALVAPGMALALSHPAPASWPWLCAACLGAALALAGLCLLLMWLLTWRALAREPGGAAYSIAERLD